MLNLPPPPPPQPWSPAFEFGPLARGLSSGAAYALVAAAISHPFDTIKVHQQAGTLIAARPNLLGRILVLYKGIGPATAASVLFRTVPFIGYEATRTALREREMLSAAPLLAAFLGGAVGGVLRGCLETPAEVLADWTGLDSAGLGWT